MRILDEYVIKQIDKYANWFLSKLTLCNLIASS